MEQLFILDTKNKTIQVLENNKLIKKINNIYIGKKGVANIEDATEGDMKTPLGTFNLGVAFGTHNLDIKYPYIKIDNGSYWVDDYKSKYYNCFVEIDNKVDNYNYPYIFNCNEKKFSSAEHLNDYKTEYEYAIFIEFNINNNLGNNKGSAIFMHCHGKEKYTHGCIAIPKNDMKWILYFINRNENPKILIK